MSTETNPQVLAFVGRLASEPAFREQFTHTEDNAEVLSKLRAAGYDFSFEEFSQTMKMLSEMPPDSLPDELLAQVSGGLSVGDIWRGTKDFVKDMGDKYFIVDAAPVTDWVADKLASGIKAIAKHLP